MERKKINLLLLLAVGLSTASCTKVPLEAMPEQGEVRVHLDWESQAVPAGMQYHFYPVGETGSVTHAEGTASEFSGQLPYGRYVVLTHNTQVRNVAFTGMESYATATAELIPVGGATRAGGLTPVEQPSVLCAGTSAEVEVVRLDTVSATAVPKQLTRSLKLTFKLNDISGVSRIEGTLCGLYPSVLLTTGAPTATAAGEAPRTAACFSEAVTSEQASTTVTFLGLLNPEGGQAYRNMLHLTLTGDGGWTQETDADLTRVLTDILAGSAGEAELEVDNGIEIKITPTAMGLSAGVTAWIQGGEGAGDIYYY